MKSNINDKLIATAFSIINAIYSPLLVIDSIASSNFTLFSVEIVRLLAIFTINFVILNTSFLIDIYRNKKAKFTRNLAFLFNMLYFAM